MKISRKIAFAALLLGAIHGASIAGDSGVGYGMVSSNGIGFGYTKSVNDDFAVRGQFNFLPKSSYSGNVGDFGSNSSLNVEATWKSVQLLGDWYPSASGLRLTGGVVLNRNKINIDGTGNVNNIPATVSAEIKMCCSGVAPYLGIGYSTRPKNAKGWGLMADLGLMYQDPRVKLTASGAGGATIPDADIAKQTETVNDAIRKLRTFPVIGVGLSYAF